MPRCLYPQVNVNRRTRLAHRVRAEQALGKPLPAKAVVHHVDGSRSITSQLVICQNQAYHFLLHIRERVLKAGGNPNTDRICYVCKEVKPMTAFTGNGSVIRACKKCVNKRRGLSNWLKARKRGVPMRAAGRSLEAMKQSKPSES